MIYVVARPDGTTERVNGRAALYALLRDLTDVQRRERTVRLGQRQDTADHVYERMDPKVWGGIREDWR